MKNRIKDKLRSQMGASITFALLLFLVCAVLSSVIIVAATTVSGRMAGIAEMDQRYYSVTSASQLMKAVLVEKPFIVKITTSSSDTVYTDSGSSTIDNDDETFITYLIPNVDSSIELAELENMTAEDIAGISDVIIIDKTENDFAKPTFKSIQSYAAYKYYRNESIPKTATDPFKLMLKSSVREPEGSDSDPLAITIEERLDLDKGGSIVLILYNTNYGDPFKQQLVFGADFVKSTPPPENEPSEMKGYSEWTDPSSGDKHYSYTITTTKTEMEIDSFAWNLHSMKTLNEMENIS